MRSHGSLFEAIASLPNLEAALRRAASGKGARDSVRRFVADAAVELPRLSDELRHGRYEPRAFRQFRILDPKPRLISCSDFRDRVVHHAVCAFVAPAIEGRLIEDNYACRVGKGSHRAIQRAQVHARAHRYFLRVDIRRYYDSIDHAILLGKLARLFRERRLLDLLERIVTHAVPGQTRGKGLPIGSLTSQWLANYYLDETDHWIKEERRVSGYVRYMDDMAAWSDSRDALHALAGDLDERLRERLAVGLKHQATVVAPSSEGMPFLGWRVYPGLLRQRGSRLRRRRRLLGQRLAQFAAGELDEVKLQACARSLDGPRRFLGCGEPLVPRREGTMEQRRQPGEPWRQLEERRRVELPRGVPQQERPVEPQRQPGLPPREHSFAGQDTKLSHPSIPVFRTCGNETPDASAASKRQAHRGGGVTFVDREVRSCP